MPGEEVTFCSGGCAIAGTFTGPADPVAAALLVPGGGKSDRNSGARLPGGRMLRIGVDKAIAGARVCALRYGKRGAGASGGEYLRAGMDDILRIGPQMRDQMVMCSAQAFWPPGSGWSRRWSAPVPLRLP